MTAVGGYARSRPRRFSKMALLLGPDGARDVLSADGGVIVHDSGEVEVVGPIDDDEYLAPQREPCEAP